MRLDRPAGSADQHRQGQKPSHTLPLRDPRRNLGVRGNAADDQSQAAALAGK
jgi:hypothetical protein